jgi:hypothetical protein
MDTDMDIWREEWELLNFVSSSLFLLAYIHIYVSLRMYNGS